MAHGSGGVDVGVGLILRGLGDGHEPTALQYVRTPTRGLTCELFVRYFLGVAADVDIDGTGTYTGTGGRINGHGGRELSSCCCQ